MKVRAYAKVNLGLNVKSRRDDGYHELEMIMVPVSFYDEIDISIANKMSFVSNKDYINRNKNNSILKAIEVLRDKYHFKENFSIKLNKNIPTQGGLAGGSADGAATIKEVARLLSLPMSKEDYQEACLKIGSDEYFCLKGSVAEVYGTGDIVLPFKNNLEPLHILLVKPFKGVSTKESFKALNLENCDHPDISLIKKAMVENNYDLLCKSIGNSLEEPSIRLNKEIKVIKEKMVHLGLDAALMSGSGSTVFGLSQNEDVIDEVMAKLYKQRYYVRKVKIIERPFDFK